MHETMRNERPGLSGTDCNNLVIEDDFENVIVAYRDPTIIIKSMDDVSLHYNFHLFDVLGRKITQRTISGNYIFQFDVSNLPFGIYIVLLETSEDKMARKILIPNLK